MQRLAVLADVVPLELLHALLKLQERLVLVYREPLSHLLFYCVTVHVQLLQKAVLCALMFLQDVYGPFHNRLQCENRLLVIKFCLLFRYGVALFVIEPLRQDLLYGLVLRL